jgi:hypothetical protein
MLRDSLDMIVTSHVRTREDLVSVEFTMSPGDVENLAGLPPGWFTNKPGEVIKLRDDARRPMTASPQKAVIVEFPGRSK